MTTDRDILAARIAEAEPALTALTASLNKARTELAALDGTPADSDAPSPAEPHEETPRNGKSAAAGREEALRRHGRTNSGIAEAETERQKSARHRREDAAQEEARQEAQDRAEEGRAEARRRLAARRRTA
ncbi:UNVERIFIED_ORG: hypothetical protein E4P37_07910 [Bacillus sp. AZ43]